LKKIQKNEIRLTVFPLDRKDGISGDERGLVLQILLQKQNKKCFTILDPQIRGGEKKQFFKTKKSTFLKS
jgi:hypothetical protein